MVKPNLPPGFTVVELLVVITIIVVLLAMLVPAMEKSIYQAELATCGSRMAGAARGVVGYAVDQKRTYPYRPCIANPGPNRWPQIIKDVMAGTGGTSVNSQRADDRPYLLAALGGSLDLLLDPLCPKIDLENAQPDAIVAANYSLWFGMYFLPAQGGGEGMFQLGDRLDWTDISRGPAIKHSFRVLISDWDQPLPLYENGSAARKVTGSHPDKEQVLSTERVEDAGYTLSWWRSGGVTGTSHRPPVDLNFAMTDGSVERRNDVRWNDDDMARAPYQVQAPAASTGDLDGAWNHLPKQ